MKYDKLGRRRFTRAERIAKHQQEMDELMARLKAEGWEPPPFPSLFGDGREQDDLPACWHEADRSTATVH
jgi:hypothetical protein